MQATTGYIGPLIGLAGVLTGACIAYLSGAASSRRAFNADRINRSLDYCTEVIHSAEQQVILYSRINEEIHAFIDAANAAVRAGEQPRVDFVVTERDQERLASATDAWRMVLAKRIVWAPAELSAAISAFDDQRDLAARAYNETRLDDFRTACASLDRKAMLMRAAVQGCVLDANEHLARDQLLGPARWRELRKVRRTRSQYEKWRARLLAEPGADSAP